MGKFFPPLGADKFPLTDFVAELLLNRVLLATKLFSLMPAQLLKGFQPAHGFHQLAAFFDDVGIELGHGGGSFFNAFVDVQRMLGMELEIDRRQELIRSSCQLVFAGAQALFHHGNFRQRTVARLVEAAQLPLLLVFDPRAQAQDRRKAKFKNGHDRQAARSSASDWMLDGSVASAPRSWQK